MNKEIFKSGLIKSVLLRIVTVLCIGAIVGSIVVIISTIFLKSSGSYEVKVFTEDLMHVYEVDKKPIFNGGGLWFKKEDGTDVYILNGIIEIKEFEK